MNYKLEDLINDSLFKQFRGKLEEIFEFTSAVLDVDGKVLMTTAWQDVCTKFHRVHPVCSKECTKSDQYIKDHLNGANPVITYTCAHGLIDCATPIIIDGQHLANFYTGQIFLKEPDLDLFRQQARTYGFDEKAYLEAVKKVPILSQKKLDQHLVFIKIFADVLSGLGLKKIREIEITQRNRENELKLANIYDKSPIAIALFNHEGILVDMNPAGLELFGVQSDGDVRGLKLFEDPNIPKDQLALLRKGVAVRCEMPFDFGLVKKYNLYKTTRSGMAMLDLLITPIGENGSQAFAYMAQIIDITARKCAEELLRESEVRLKNIIEGTNIGTWQWNVRTGVTISNERWAEIIGYTLHELAPVSIDTWMKFCHPDDLKTSRALLEKHFNKESDYYECEVRMRHKDGSWVWVLSRGKVTEWDSDGKPLIMSGTHQDITERKRSEDAIVESEQLFSNMFRKSPVTIVLWEPATGKIVDVNDKCLRVLEYSREEFVGRTAAEIGIFADPAARLTLLGILKNNGNVSDFECKFRSKTGRIVTGILSSVHIAIRGVTYQLISVIDITTRKEAEDELNTSVAQLRANLENVPYVAVQWYDEAGRVLYWNPASEILYGWKAAEAFGRTLDELFFTREATEEFLRMIGDIRATGRPQGPYESTFRRKDGSSGWLMSTTFSMPLNKERMGFVCMDVDITDRKLAEEALRESEQKYRTLVESANDAIVMTDLSGKRLFANEAFYANKGYESADDLASDGTSVVHPDDLADVQRKMRELMAKGVMAGEYRSRHKDGHWVNCYNKATLIRDKAGKPYAILSIIRDITQEKKEEYRLEQLNRCFLEFGHDPEKNITKLTELCGKLLGATTAIYHRIEGDMLRALGQWNVPPDFAVKTDAKGCICTDVIKQNCELLVIINNLPSTNYFRTDPNVSKYGLRTYMGQPVRYRGKTIGSLSIIFQKDYNVTDNDRRLMGIIGSAVGIEEERKHMEEHRLRLEKVESLGVVAGGIAHDFNNLLQVMQGNISLSLKHSSGGKITESLVEVEKATARAKGLANQLLTFAKGGMPVKVEASINDLVKDTVNFFLSGTSIQLDMKLADDLHVLKFDVDQMSQVIQNIVVNAKEAMLKNGTLKVNTVNAALEDGRNYTKIAITDNGRGIAEGDVKRLFEPYYTTKPNGNGLGLPVANSIVQKHGGRIEVRSVPGTGTTFEIYLPAESAKAKMPENVKVAKRVSRAVPAGKNIKRILVLDDEKQVLDFIKKALTMMGYEAKTAGKAEKAVALYVQGMKKNKPYDAVIIDLTLRGSKGGGDVAKDLIKIDPKARCIVSSGYSNDPIMANYTRHGFCEVLVKPYGVDKLELLLKKLLK